MSLGTHVQALKKKHAHLSQQVEEAHRSPSVDELKVRELKKQKLRLKEEITRLDG